MMYECMRDIGISGYIGRIIGVSYHPGIRRSLEQYSAILPVVELLGHLVALVPGQRLLGHLFLLLLHPYLLGG